MGSVLHIYFETIDMVELSTALLLVEARTGRVSVRFARQLQRAVLKICRETRAEAIEKYGLVAAFFEMVEREQKA